MNKSAYLEDQARRAERLARSILDDVTVERLLAFAGQCRRQVAELSDATERVAAQL